jgi:hypothetical protein
MGLDLTGKGGYFRWTWSGWGNVLKLGLVYGWEPAGTGPPRGTPAAEWEGDYASNQGQLFKAREAKQLAGALERALADFPDYRRPEDADAGDAWSYLCTPQGRQSLEDFIAFLLAGSFRLY